MKVWLATRETDDHWGYLQDEPAVIATSREAAIAWLKADNGEAESWVETDDLLSGHFTMLVPREGYDSRYEYDLRYRLEEWDVVTG